MHVGFLVELINLCDVFSRQARELIRQVRSAGLVFLQGTHRNILRGTLLIATFRYRDRSSLDSPCQEDLAYGHLILCSKRLEKWVRVEWGSRPPKRSVGSDDYALLLTVGDQV